MPMTKALIINQDAFIPLPIPVLFNPPEYQLQHTNNYTDLPIPGLGSTVLQFVNGTAPTLTMDLFCDTSDLGIDVRLYTMLITNLMDLNAHTHAPPRLLFLWGSLIFPCVLTDVQEKYDLFNSFGLPLRATLSVTLKSNVPAHSLLAMIPLQSTDRTKRRILKSGETLQSIAAQEYEDPRQWRAIARANGIDNPFTLRPGTSLVLPTL